MATINVSALNVFMVTNKDGSIDRKASHAKLEEQMLEHELRNETENGLVSAAVGSFFDSHKGELVILPFIVNSVVGSLNPTKDSYPVLKAATERFIRANTATKTAPGIFTMRKGAGGGFGRTADLPVKAEAGAVAAAPASATELDEDSEIETE